MANLFKDRFTELKAIGFKFTEQNYHTPEQNNIVAYTYEQNNTLTLSKKNTLIPDKDNTLIPEKNNKLIHKMIL